jgi:hypothetical protein
MPCQLNADVFGDACCSDSLRELREDPHGSTGIFRFIEKLDA